MWFALSTTKRLDLAKTLLKHLLMVLKSSEGLLES